MTIRATSLLLFSLLVGTATAYQPSSLPSKNAVHTTSKSAWSIETARATATAAVATALLFANPLSASASSKEAAQISLNNLPPSSVSIQIRDLPVIGNLISGTYTKVADNTISKPSVTIFSPADKVKAISSLATGGHLEFDVNGILQTHLDVDVAADEAGVLKVRVANNLIPKLPFNNLASAKASSPTGGKPSPWNMVTNMGSGETYYYNEKSGVTQYDRPDGF